jgi:hypothetical protein
MTINARVAHASLAHGVLALERLSVSSSPDPERGLKAQILAFVSSFPADLFKIEVWKTLHFPLLRGTWSGPFRQSNLQPLWSEKLHGTSLLPATAQRGFFFGGFGAFRLRLPAGPCTATRRIGRRAGPMALLRKPRLRSLCDHQEESSWRASCSLQYPWQY